MRFFNPGASEHKQPFTVQMRVRYFTSVVPNLRVGPLQKDPTIVFTYVELIYLHSIFLILYYYSSQLKFVVKVFFIL